MFRSSRASCLAAALCLFSAGTVFAQLPGSVPAPSGASPLSSSLSQTQTVAPATRPGQTAASAQQNAEQQNANRRETPVPVEPDTEFQRMVQATTGRHLPIFGASLFSGVPSTFAPVDEVPVSAGYILGPGDEITLQLSGQINQQLDLTVDRSGAVAIPGVGTVHVAGLPYGQLTPFLNREIGRYYRNFTLNANLGRLRTIQVFVVGQARRPGSYSISSLSTLLNAIFASGGPSSGGSLRDIQVRRNGEVIDHFDLYDLLLHGDKTHDIPLASGDVIFFPFAGPQVAVLGSVDVQAIYELKGPTTVAQAIQFAGGETSVAAGGSVRVDRVIEHSERAALDLTPQLAETETLQNGDVISVLSILDRFRNAVTLRGNVANPGRYVWHDGMRLSDLFPNRESLIIRDYWTRRNQLGEMPQDYLPAQEAQPAPVPTEGALQASGNQADRSAEATAQQGSASGTTGGSALGTALTDNTGLFHPRNDVVLSAPDIDWNYAVIERQNSADLTTTLIPFNLGKLVLDHDASQNFALQPGDVVTVFSKADLRVPSSQQTRFVRLEGEFVAAGVYSVLPGETLRQLVQRAGGFTPDAYLYASEFTRESTRRLEQQRLNEYADELEAEISSVTATNQARAVTPADAQAASASEAGARAAVARLRRTQPIGRIVLDMHPDSQGIGAVPDLPLEDGDRFVVPRIPSSVTVEGQVYSANAFLYAPHSRVMDYLQRAGGPNREADRHRIFVLRADGSVVSRQYRDVFRAPIYPGDTVVVPPVLDKRAVLQRIVDISGILGQVGFAAAALSVLTQ